MTITSTQILKRYKISRATLSRKQSCLTQLGNTKPLVFTLESVEAVFGKPENDLQQIFDILTVFKTRIKSLEQRLACLELG